MFQEQEAGHNPQHRQNARRPDGKVHERPPVTSILAASAPASNWQSDGQIENKGPAVEEDLLRGHPMQGKLGVKLPVSRIIVAG